MEWWYAIVGKQKAEVSALEDNADQQCSNGYYRYEIIRFLTYNTMYMIDIHDTLE
jgi:hypothetical protein